MTHGCNGVVRQAWVGQGRRGDGLVRLGRRGPQRTGQDTRGWARRGWAGNDGIGEVREASNGWVRIGVAGVAHSGVVGIVGAENVGDRLGRKGIATSGMSRNGWDGQEWSVK